VPDSIKQMIEKQVNHLNAAEQRTLEAASRGNRSMTSARRKSRRSLRCTLSGARTISEPQSILDCFNQSIKIAQRQKASSLELRALMSMARLYQNQSKREEARTLLAQTYSRFTEGFATTDLREAKSLLDELS
jgi:hypothetical protein